MGFWDKICNAQNGASSELQSAESEAMEEVGYLSDRQLEDRIKKCGNSLTELKKKSVYANEYERRKAKK